jgi:large subunit ribosomal protein L10
MKRSEKEEIINELSQQINSYNHFYLADIAGLNAEETSDLRRTCFEKDVKLVVAKNTLLRKAISDSEKGAEELSEVLKGNTSILFCDTGNIPAKLIKEFSKKSKIEKPILKGAFVEESVYVGAENLEALVNIKSREELIADVIALLQSPAKNVVSALQSSSQTLHGVLKTLGERAE